MPKKSNDKGYRGAERRDVVINEYMSIDRLPMSLGQTGPVYRVDMDDLTSTGYIPRAYDDKNER